ncbi:MAG: ABC transporter ATP-binding protein [Oscillospiraceae bacterium]|nr:ABC transporter ATP-binding protein [Oscillospiraceae bacterium]
MNVLEVKNLCKKYPSFTLNNVSFTVPEGSVTGFIGRNGAGKSTTLKSILGLVHPDSGEAVFFGKNFTEHEREIKQEIGYVSGGSFFYPNKPIKAVTAVTRRFYGNWDDNLFKNYMEKFALDENNTQSQLSEGMKIKYSLTLALSHHAKLLILDEPTSGLDPISRDELLDIFIELSREGTTILFSTHITSDLERSADGIIYIRGGRIADQDSLNSFTDRYKAVKLTEAEFGSADKALLIGCKPAKIGYTAIALSENADKLPGELSPADLETIMIHLEKVEQPHS